MVLPPNPAVAFTETSTLGFLDGVHDSEPIER